MPLALSGTEEHRDHVLDQSGDHETKAERPNLGSIAEQLLVAVADAGPESLDLAEALARAVLADPLVRRALALEELVRTRSPFALVRAVELAETLLDHGARGDAGAVDHRT